MSKKRIKIKLDKKGGNVFEALSISEERKDEIVEMITEIAQKRSSKIEILAELAARLPDPQELFFAAYIYGSRVGWEGAMLRTGHVEAIEFGPNAFPSIFWGEA